MRFEVCFENTRKQRFRRSVQIFATIHFSRSVINLPGTPSPRSVYGNSLMFAVLVLSFRKISYSPTTPPPLSRPYKEKRFYSIIYLRSGRKRATSPVQFKREYRVRTYCIFRFSKLWIFFEDLAHSWSTVDRPTLFSIRRENILLFLRTESEKAKDRGRRIYPCRRTPPRRRGTVTRATYARTKKLISKEFVVSFAFTRRTTN